MKRLHGHVRVKNLKESIAFYSALFSSAPAVQKTAYAKWLPEDPRVNSALSESAGETGIAHLGLQAESQEELNEVYAWLQAKGTVRHEEQTVCCYAQSEKSWIADLQGGEWEAFYTFGEAPSCSAVAADAPVAEKACCAPACCP